MSGGTHPTHSLTADTPPSSAILRYDPDTEKWTEAGEMRESKSSHAVTTINIKEVAPYCQ